MKLAVILVNYNGKQYNDVCMDSILTNGGMEELKIIVVDNASQDDSVPRLEEKKARHTGLDKRDVGQYEKERTIGFATGCCLWVPWTVIGRAGVLDERFFLYYEDTEYSFRLQRAGVPIWYCPQAVLYHKVGASTRGADSALCAYYIARNWLLCNRLHLGADTPCFLDIMCLTGPPAVFCG